MSLPKQVGWIHPTSLVVGMVGSQCGLETKGVGKNLTKLDYLGEHQGSLARGFIALSGGGIDQKTRLAVLGA